MADINQWFDSIDKDRSGTLDVKELQAALALGNLVFSLKTVAHMVRIHDPDRSGTINFQEFGALHAFLMNMQASFKYFDRDRSNSLDKQETFQALSHAGYRLDGPAFEALFKAYDPDHDNVMGLPEYIAMTLVLQSAAKTFQAFDSQRTGRISLGWDQWIYAVANTV
ncbi:hypothetical protein WJX73_001488 [Symbiochloris irregularis]|uniref:EF-hand domain-containing protein n=1 Tax=Symbiochloris irregularis TaxID=706552 RepID=A0AAW1PRT8_9CHLO